MTLAWFSFTGGPGVHDPCEREPADVLSELSAQQADALTHSAQVCSAVTVLVPFSLFFSLTDHQMGTNKQN